MDTFLSILGSAVLFSALYFEIFLLVSIFEKKRLFVSEEEFAPEVTVIVPVFNEEKTIESTLESLLSLDYPLDKLSIIVIDDGSTDNTLQALERYVAYKNIRVISKENGGKYTALNIGIQNCNTEFIGCLDADSFVEKHALKKIMSRFKDSKVMAVTPSMVIDNPTNILRHMQRAEYNFGNFIRQALSIIGAIHITPGPFSFFRKEVFEKIGNYRHAHNTEDMEMAMRMQKNGMKIDHATDALVYTVGPGTVGKLYKQRVRWVSGFIANLIDYRDMVLSRKFGDLGLLVLPFSIFSITMTFVLVGITLFKLIKYLIDTIIKISVVGFTPLKLNFDWFYLNTSILSIMSIVFILLIISLSLYGERSTSGRLRFSLSVLYFAFLYSFIAPFWLFKSIYNNLLSKETTWR